MARPVLLPISALTHEHSSDIPTHLSASNSNSRQRSYTTGVAPYGFLDDKTAHDWDRHGPRASVDAPPPLSREAQVIWESLMTLNSTRHNSLDTHLRLALPLLSHPSLPLPPTLQILIFTTSLSPPLRALILSRHSSIRTLDEAVHIAQMAERARDRMEWIGRAMGGSGLDSRSSLVRSSFVPVQGQGRGRRLSVAKRAGERMDRISRAMSASVSPPPTASGTKRVRMEEPSSRADPSKSRRVKLVAPTSTTSSAFSIEMDRRPSSTGSESAASAASYSDNGSSPRSQKSGIEFLADVAMEVARERTA